MRALALAMSLCLALSAWADPLVPARLPHAAPPPDAPLALGKGEVAPVSGRLVPDAVWVLHQADVAATRAERDSLKASVESAPTAGTVIALGVGVLLVGAGAGVAITCATGHCR